MNQPIKWAIVHERDQFDSHHDVLKVIDASPESLSHPQGPLTLLHINVNAFAPHIEQAKELASLIVAAPAMLDALQRIRRCPEAELVHHLCQHALDQTQADHEITPPPV